MTSMYDSFLARIGKDVLSAQDIYGALQRLNMTADDIENSDSLNGIEKEMLKSYMQLVYYSVKNMPTKINDTLYKW